MIAENITELAEDFAFSYPYAVAGDQSGREAVKDTLGRANRLVPKMRPDDLDNFARHCMDHDLDGFSTTREFLYHLLRKFMAHHGSNRFVYSEPIAAARGRKSANDIQAEKYLGILDGMIYDLQVKFGADGVLAVECIDKQSLFASYQYRPECEVVFGINSRAKIKPIKIDWTQEAMFFRGMGKIAPDVSERAEDRPESTQGASVGDGAVGAKNAHTENPEGPPVFDTYELPDEVF